MQINIANALSGTARPGVSEEALARLDERVGPAHDRIARGLADREFGYTALGLPERVDPDRIRETVAPFGRARQVLTVGIGGSALGATTLTDALGLAGHVAIDNVDPVLSNRLFERLPLQETVVHVVSKSGTTAETLANFLCVRAAIDEAGGDWTEQTVVTTGQDGPLREMADRHDLPSCETPAGVPGRFAALSPVGLVPLALLGGDIEGVLQGGRDAVAGLSGSLFDCPAYAYAAICHALERRDAVTNVIMPYQESWESLGEWVAQLWAESLGKDGGGLTPVRALGATDQHSQLQLYRAGRRDKLVTFLAPRDRPHVAIPETDREGVGYLGDGDTTMGDLIDAELTATEASLRAAERPNVRLTFDSDAVGIGEMLVALQAACMMAGELRDVATFTQPAVEWGKRAARGLLSAESSEEADSIEDRAGYVIGDDAAR